MKLGRRGTLTLPKDLREGLDPATVFEAVRRDDGIIELRPHSGRDPSQAWFWTDRWQQMEREADAAIAEGRVKTFDDLEGFLAHLDSIPLTDENGPA